jgi:hypothetical protein
MSIHSPTILIILIALATGACTREHPNPEELDPIYQDFVKQQRLQEKSIEEALKALEVAEKEFASTDPRTLDRKLKTREIQKVRDAIRMAQEKAEYLRIRADLRKVYGRKSYKMAFREGKMWPDPAEYDAYKTNKSLVEADRSWSSRVPKTVHQELSSDSMKKAPTE